MVKKPLLFYNRKEQSQAKLTEKVTEASKGFMVKINSAKIGESHVLSHIETIFPLTFFGLQRRVVFDCQKNLGIQNSTLILFRSRKRKHGDGPRREEDDEEGINYKVDRRPEGQERHRDRDQDRHRDEKSSKDKDAPKEKNNNDLIDNKKS